MGVAFTGEILIGLSITDEEIRNWETTTTKTVPSCNHGDVARQGPYCQQCGKRVTSYQKSESDLNYAGMPQGLRAIVENAVENSEYDDDRSIFNWSYEDSAVYDELPNYANFHWAGSREDGENHFFLGISLARNDRYDGGRSTFWSNAEIQALTEKVKADVEALGFDPNRVGIMFATYFT